MAAGQTQQKLSVRILDALTPFLIVIIFAAVFGSFFYYIIQPESQKYLPGGPSNEFSVKELLKSRKTYRDDLNGLFTFYTSSKTQEQDPLTMILPSDKDVPTLYALFEKMAKDIDVGLQVIDISDARETTKSARSMVKRVPVALRFVNVDYGGLKRIIAALEHNGRLTAIENYSYDPGNNVASFSVVTYYFTQSP
jgi:hypothetical protein